MVWTWMECLIKGSAALWWTDYSHRFSPDCCCVLMHKCIRNKLLQRVTGKTQLEYLSLWYFFLATNYYQYSSQCLWNTSPILWLAIALYLHESSRMYATLILAPGNKSPRGTCSWWGCFGFPHLRIRKAVEWFSLLLATTEDICGTCCF